VLWAAGQKRVVREGRERLSELYVGMRDGYIAGEVAIGRAKSQSGIPDYARGDPEQRDVQTRRGLADLMRDFPGNVEPGSREFMN